MSEWAEVKARVFAKYPACHKCGAPAVQAHHAIVPDYGRYRPWVHNDINCQGLCLGGCHVPTSYEERLAFVQLQIARGYDVAGWLDAAPKAAWTRVQEVRRML